jgi:membrane protease YdiL (CAAX protease family)
MQINQHTPAAMQPTPAVRPSWPLRILRYPLTRIVLGTIAVAGSYVIVLLPLQLTAKAIDQLHNPIFQLFSLLAAAACAFLVYTAFVRLIERRRPTELGTRHAVQEFAIGAAGGAGLMCAVIGVMFAVGAYRVESNNSPFVLLGWLGIGISSGIFEELMARCLWYRILEEWLGTWLALVISSAFFGFGHAGNSGATFFSCVAISLEAGMLLAAAFMITRRLWLAAGLHAAWNITQGGIFGAAVSGGHERGLLNASISGPDWLTGGAFGPEASVVALTICTVAGIALLAVAYQRGLWVPLFWRRRPGHSMPVPQSSGGDAAILAIPATSLREPAAPENQPDRRTDAAAEDGPDRIHKP